MASFKQKMMCMVVMASLLVMTSGCASMINSGLRTGIKLAHPAIENIEVALFKQANIELVKEGLPGQLLLLEGLLGTAPDDMLLLTMATKAYTGLGMLVEDDDPEQATKLYTRGTECGLQLLKHHSGFKKALERGENLGEAARKIKSKKFVPPLMWTAACMGANVLLNAGDPMIAIDLAPVNTMVNQVVELDGDYFYGFAHMFVGTVNSMLPETFGGDKEKAVRAFETIFEMNDGKFLLPKVMFARFSVTDDDLSKATLQNIINTPDGEMPEIELLNQIAKSKAAYFLKQKGSL